MQVRIYYFIFQHDMRVHFHYRCLEEMMYHTLPQIDTSMTSKRSLINIKIKGQGWQFLEGIYHKKIKRCHRHMCINVKILLLCCVYKHLMQKICWSTWSNIIYFVLFGVNYSNCVMAPVIECKCPLETISMNTHNTYIQSLKFSEKKISCLQKSCLL